MNDLRDKAESLLGELEVFFGDANNAEAAVYVHYPMREFLGDGVELVAKVTGPTCNYAHTLPARIPMHDQGPGPYALAEARVPDPCFWTPEAPYLYEVEVQAIRNEQMIAVERRTLAIRRLGVAAHSFYLDGKRWVPRAASLPDTPSLSLEECRAASLALFVKNPSDELCEQATLLGVLLVAQVTSTDATNVLGELGRLARHGAVGVVVIDPRIEFPAEHDPSVRNLVLASHVGENHSGPIPDWAAAVVYTFDSPRHAASFRDNSELPVIAARPTVNASSAKLVRAACDALQRDLAPHGDFAGYLV